MYEDEKGNRVRRPKGHIVQHHAYGFERPDVFPGDEGMEMRSLWCTARSRSCKAPKGCTLRLRCQQQHRDELPRIDPRRHESHLAMSTILPSLPNLAPRAYPSAAAEPSQLAQLNDDDRED